MRKGQYYVYTYIISVVAHVISCFVDQGYLSLYRRAVLKCIGVVMRVNTCRSTTTRFTLLTSSRIEFNYNRSDNVYPLGHTLPRYVV